MDLTMDDVVCSKYLKTRTRNGFSSPKNIVTTHGTSFFSKLPIVKKNIQKHLDLLLETKLKFLTHINEKFKKSN